MKLQIVGIEGSFGVGKTSGNAYEIGNLHTLADLAPPLKDDHISLGQMGTSYRCPLPLIVKIKDLPRPFFAEVDIRPVMRFGKREDQVFDIKPLVTTTKAA